MILFFRENHSLLPVIAMFSTIMGLILLLAVILIIGFVIKAVKIAVYAAIIIGIIALILHFTKKS